MKDSGDSARTCARNSDCAARRDPVVCRTSSPKTSLKRFFDAIREGGDLQDEIMLKLLFYTAIRGSELVSIRVEQFRACEVWIFSKRKADNTSALQVKWD